MSYTFFEGYRGDDEPMGKMENEAEIRMIINLSHKIFIIFAIEVEYCFYAHPPATFFCIRLFS